MQNYNQLFNDHWAIYNKILKNNYMGHDEVFSIMRSALSEHVVEKSYTFLDIGCGDAQIISKYISGTSIIQYTGIDLSNDALHLAKNNTSLLNCPCSFIEKDLQHALSTFVETGITYDVIFSGFALHHLSEPKKQKALHNIFNTLKPCGVFLYIDVVIEEGESRTDYLDRYLFEPKHYWSELSTDELALLDEHVRSSDYPSTKIWLQNASHACGFKACDCLMYDKQKANILLAMIK